jgi:hypothetical protein
MEIMTDEIENIDLNSQEQANSEEVRRLNVVQAARHMKCSIPTVYSRAKKFGWERGIDEQGLAWMEIPVRFLKNKYDTEPEVEGNEVAKQAILEIRAVHDENMKLMKDLVETKESLLKAQQAQIDALNNQIAAQNNQLVLLRDKNTQASQPPPPPKPKTFLERLAFLFPGDK